MRAHEKSIRGVRIRTLNMVMLITSCVLFVAVLDATFLISKRYHAVVAATEDYIAGEKNAALVHNGSEYLTEQVRLYVQTLDKKHALNYFTELYTTRRRDTALENLSQEKTDPEAYAYLQQALLKSDELTSREIYAIKLAATAEGRIPAELPQVVRDTELSPEDEALDAQAKIGRARDLVFNVAYQDAKHLIMNNLSYFLNNITKEMLKTQRDETKALGDILTNQRILLIILCLLNLLTFAMIIVLIIKPIQVYMQCIKEEKMLKLVGAYEFKHLALIYNDIYELTAANGRMLQYKAEHDPLTGLMNRSAFETLKEMLKDQDNPMALLLIDVDHFKEVNDRYGHEMGDRILCKVARELQQSFRAEDFCIRFGGDEFAVVVKNAGLEMAPIIKNKVAMINDTLLHPAGDSPKVSLSVGVAFSTGFPDSLFRDADSALYEVKARGRCGCAFHNNEQKDAEDNATAEKGSPAASDESAAH